MLTKTGAVCGTREMNTYPIRPKRGPLWEPRNQEVSCVFDRVGVGREQRKPDETGRKWWSLGGMDVQKNVPKG